MKKYLVNRVLRSLFSVIMVMILSVVLVFSLIPLDYVTAQNEDVKTAKKYGEDEAKKKALEVLQEHGYIDYVSQVDYCKSIISDTSGNEFKTCIARSDKNKYKHDFIKKYEDAGWEMVKLTVDNKNNCDFVTRDTVASGEYDIQEGQYFHEDLNDAYLYEKTSNGSESIVTFNNVIYFRKKTNPLKTFWNWFSNLVSFDNKNKIENYIEWDNETGKYLTLNDKYDLEFSYSLLSKPDKPVINSFEYVVSEEDKELKASEVTVASDVYEGAGGISSSAKKGALAISKITTTKNGEQDSNGTMTVTFSFTNGTSEDKTVDVARFIGEELIPIYVGNDNYWYIGNTKTTVVYQKEVKDWDHTPSNYSVNNELTKCSFETSELKRGYSIQKDEYGVPALVCKGCEYKYSIYFTNSFPFIHFNVVKFSLGQSLNNYKGQDVTNLLVDKQGDQVSEDVVFPTGEVSKDSIESFHTCSYKATLNQLEQKLFVDNYARCKSLKNESSMMGISFIIGIISTIIAYFVGIPLGVLMAKYKDGIFDKIAMVYIIIMFSVPSLAYIYFMSYIGRHFFKLPQTYAYGNYLTYIMPVISLSLGSIASLMMWTRRYMIDQGNADYVKFARAKGLSESQIFFKHILRNAIVPIAHGVPGSIVGSVVGALITEQVYAVPGTGKLMVTAIQTYDNWIAIGLIFFYTILGITSMILGDITITLVDPRISFVDTGGRK